MFEWLKPGAKFAIRNNNGYGYTCQILTVRKVYKTGKFVVEGDQGNTQYTPGKDKTACRSAAYSFTRLDLYEGDVIAAVEASKALSEAKGALYKEIDRLSAVIRAANNRPGDADAAAAVIAEWKRIGGDQ